MCLQLLNRLGDAPRDLFPSSMSFLNAPPADNTTDLGLSQFQRDLQVSHSNQMQHTHTHVYCVHSFTVFAGTAKSLRCRSACHGTRRREEDKGAAHNFLLFVAFA